MSDVNKLYDKLVEEFPTEAYQVDSSRGFNLTSLKAQFVRERLNTVFGFNGWRFTGEFKDLEDNGVLFFGKLSVKVGENDHTVEGVGYSGKKKNLGDVYKSANTDALSKAASNLGIGNSVYKGMISADSVKTANKTTKAPPQKRSSFNKPGTNAAPATRGWK
jgi:hypothetical protein